MERLKAFLKKIKLIKNFSIDIPLNTTELIRKLDHIVDEDSYNFFEGFFPDKNIFKGEVNSHGFKIKRKLSRNTNVMTVAYGSFIEHNETTKINVEIIGYDTFMKIFYCFQMIFWAIILFSMLISGINHNLEVGSALAVVFLFGMIVIMIIGPYFMMRRSMERMKYDLERELLYLTKNKDLSIS